MLRSRPALEYSARGLVGILTPQANTTAEAELAVLLSPGVGSAVSRLTCFDEDSRARLLGYFRNVGAAVRAFDTARPQVCLFACTGSTYLVGLAEEERAFASLPTRTVSAARAVLAALDALGARRLALVSPYPAWLTEACVAFWRGQEREIAEVRSPLGDRSDTRRIYQLGSHDALEQLRGLASVRADCVLITGTGMPTLGAIARAPGGTPVLSSNLCLAWAAEQTLAQAGTDRASLDRWLAPDAPWRTRLAARFPHSLENSS
jgi:maleate isomerase